MEGGTAMLHVEDWSELERRVELLHTRFASAHWSGLAAKRRCLREVAELARGIARFIEERLPEAR